MDEERRSHFRSRTVYDLDTHKELRKVQQHTSWVWIISTLFILGTFGYLLQAYQGRGFVFIFTVPSLLFILTNCIVWFRDRNGDIHYRRTLYQTDGKPPVMELSFEDCGICSINPNGGQEKVHPYDRVLSLAESRHYLLIRLELNLCLFLRKDSLEGGTTEELIRFLRARCPVMKRRVRKGLLGKYLRAAMWGVLFCCALYSAAILLDIPAAITGQITNRMTYLEIAEKLEPLGITGATPEMEEELNAYFGEYYTGINADYYNKATDLLAELGTGTYDPDTWEWTPSRNGVYWLDMEVFDVGTMYTDFLRGISALNPEVLSFTEITEDHSRVNVEDGTGMIDFSFRLNGTSHSLQIPLFSDWIDIQALGKIAEIVRSADPELRLYFASDEGQGLIVFYRTEAWAEEFTKLTRIPLYENPELIWYE